MARQRFPFVLLMLAVLGACGKVPDAPNVSGPVAERMDTFLSSLSDAGFSGAVIVRTPEGTILSKGYGLADDSTQTPFTTVTVATTGSITKQFTAAAIMRLEADGKLSVDDTITRYFKNVPDDKSAITLHQLLSHTAGFPGAVGDDFETISRDEYVAQALATPLNFMPGDGYDYSNVGYSLLAAIVETVSGTDYESYLKTHLFDPAGMEDTGYFLPDRTDRFVAVGYRDGRRWGRFDEHGWETGEISWHLLGNGGIHSTAEDMMRWDVALRGDRILPHDQVEKMYGRYGPDSPAENAWYGYGWMNWPTERGTRLIKHNGGNGIFYADFLRFVDEDAAIYLVTNRATRAASGLGWTLAELLFDPEAAAPVPSWRAPDLDRLPDTPQGETMQALVELMTQGAPDGIPSFVETRFAPGFRDMVPMEEHVRILGIIQDELRGRVVTRMRGDGVSFNLELSTDDGRPPMQLSVEFGGPAPGLISGLGVE